jgi:DNA (cytosine-5)-methyltransferase 1
MTITFIDLFCGIGGFHQALTKLGCKCVLACDIDKNCREVYKLNYGIEPVSDVRTIDPESLGHVDIICGGFPCQTFSNAGNKKMFDDERGLLFDEIIKICLIKKPKFMFLENVKHILKVGNGEVIKYIKNKIHKAGYNLQLLNMSPHNYGIPQQRERVYFVCVRKDLYDGNEIQLPSISKEICFTKFLEKDIPKKYYLDGDILKVLEAWDEMIKVFEVGEKLSPTILIHEVYNNHTEEDFEKFATWKKDYITKNKPLIKKYKANFDVWYKTHEELLNKREIFGKLEWQVGKVKPNDSIFNYFIQIRQSGIRVKKAEYFPTLVAISQIPIYGKEKRYITPRECANLQSFPESFNIPTNDRHSYKQFGNSVNVENVKTVIESTFKHYGII